MQLTTKRRWLRAMAGGLVLCLALAMCGFSGECQGIRERVVRLHILANSDSPEDQALKLQVRDAVIAASAGWLDTAADAREAQRILEGRLPQLEQLAQDTVRAAGKEYTVTAALCESYFPTRQYDTVTLPAGSYAAVRFVIGEGKGHNWWCVVFPPLCAGAAADRRQLSDVLDGEQQALVSNGERYVVRFKLVEWVQQCLRWCRSR